MDFYAKMNELQISQQDKSRLKAAHLQAMWKRICEDEQKSVARNEELIREFERVEGHMKRLSARTERLQRARQEYMNYITEHYPQWLANKQAKEESRASAVPPEPEHSRVDIKIPEPVHAPSQVYQPSPTAQDVQPEISKPCIVRKEEIVRAPEVLETPVNVALAASVPDIVLTDEEGEDHDQDYVNAELIREEIAVRSEAPPVPDQELEVEDEEDIPLPVETVPKEILDRTSPPISGRPTGLNSPTIRKLAVRDAGGEVLIPTLQLGSTDGTGVTVGTGTLSDQNMSELLGSVQSSTKTPRGQQESPLGTMEIVGNERFPEDDEVRRIVEPDVPEAALSLDGMCYLLKVVAEDFAVTFNPESFYRFEPLDGSSRRKLVYNANSGDSVNQFEPEAVSMVILEELPLVCRELPGNCMVRDEVLEDISIMVKEIVFRAKLTTDGRQLWDALYDHMRQAIAHGVLSPREMALMIGPALLRSRSKKQEKIVTVLTSLLQASDDSQMSDVSSSQATSVAASPVKQTTISAKPMVDPPAANLSAVSPRDKSTSDDDLYDNSTPRYQPDFNLTGSAAYRSMMSSGLVQTQPVDDDDDDVEDILAIKPGSAPVVVPTQNVNTDSLPTPRDDPRAVGAPSPVSTGDKLADVPITQDTTAPPAPDSPALKSSAGSQALRSTGSSQIVPSSGSQAPRVLQRLMSDNEFSDTEVSLPDPGTTANKEDKSEIDDFDGFFD